MNTRAAGGMQSLWVAAIVCCLPFFASVVRVEAFGSEGDSVPPAKAITGFANIPLRGPPGSHHFILSRDNFTDFLSSAKIYGENAEASVPPDIKRRADNGEFDFPKEVSNGKDGFEAGRLISRYATGVFTDSTGRIFVWELLGPHAANIIRKHGGHISKWTCLNLGDGTRAEVELKPIITSETDPSKGEVPPPHPIKVPKDSDIRDFQNAIDSPCITRANLVAFLSSASCHAVLPEALSKPEEQNVPGINEPVIVISPTAKGYFSDREGVIYFWYTNGPRELDLLTTKSHCSFYLDKHGADDPLLKQVSGRDYRGD